MPPFIWRWGLFHKDLGENVNPFLVLALETEPAVCRILLQILSHLKTILGLRKSCTTGGNYDSNLAPWDHPHYDIEMVPTLARCYSNTMRKLWRLGRIWEWIWTRFFLVGCYPLSATRGIWEGWIGSRQLSFSVGGRRRFTMLCRSNLHLALVSDFSPQFYKSPLKKLREKWRGLLKLSTLLTSRAIGGSILHRLPKHQHWIMTPGIIEPSCYLQKVGQSDFCPVWVRNHSLIYIFIRIQSISWY